MGHKHTTTKPQRPSRAGQAPKPRWMAHTKKVRKHSSFAVRLEMKSVLFAHIAYAEQSRVFATRTNTIACMSFNAQRILTCIARVHAWYPPQVCMIPGLT